MRDGVVPGTQAVLDGGEKGEARDTEPERSPLGRGRLRRRKVGMSTREVVGDEAQQSPCIQLLNALCPKVSGRVQVAEGDLRQAVVRSTRVGQSIGEMRPWGAGEHGSLH